jgi:hypothetical protein
MSMALFYFHVFNGHQSHDDVGSECADMAQVRAEAVDTITECVRSGFLANKDAASCFVQVVDSLGKTVMIANFTASVEVISQPLAA